MFVRNSVPLWAIFSLYLCYLTYTFFSKQGRKKKQQCTPRKALCNPSSEPLGRVSWLAAVRRMLVLAEVNFGLLDVGEDLVEERLVLRLLAALVLEQRSRAGEAAAGPDAHRATGSGLDGFVSELVWGLLAALQQLIILHLEDSILINRGAEKINF